MGVNLRRRGRWFHLDISDGGKRYRKPLHTDDRKKAEIIKNVFESALLAGEWNVAVSLDTTLARGIERFQEEYEKLHHAVSTRKYTACMFKRFQAFIAKLKRDEVTVDTIRKEDIEAYQLIRSKDVSNRKKEISASTVNRDVRELSTMFKWAQSLGMCRRNPCMGVKSLRGVKRKVQPHVDPPVGTREYWMKTTRVRGNHSRGQQLEACSLGDVLGYQFTVSLDRVEIRTLSLDVWVLQSLARSPCLWERSRFNPGFGGHRLRGIRGPFDRELPNSDGGLVGGLKGKSPVQGGFRFPCFFSVQRDHHLGPLLPKDDLMFLIGTKRGGFSIGRPFGITQGILISTFPIEHEINRADPHPEIVQARGDDSSSHGDLTDGAVGDFERRPLTVAGTLAHEFPVLNPPIAPRGDEQTELLRGLEPDPLARVWRRRQIGQPFFDLCSHKGGRVR